MPKVANQKLKLLYIADYIIHYSDEENGFYVKDLQEYLLTKGIKAEYHSITDDMKLLRDQFGMEIEGGGGRGSPFFLLSRHFPFEDLSVIAECVGSAKFISEKEALRLTETLKGFCSVYQAEEISRDYFITDSPLFYLLSASILQERTAQVKKNRVRNCVRIGYNFLHEPLNDCCLF